jgi:hypothetical protein
MGTDRSSGADILHAFAISKVIWCSRRRRRRRVLPRSTIKSSHSCRHNLRTCGSCSSGPSVTHR